MQSSIEKRLISLNYPSLEMKQIKLMEKKLGVSFSEEFISLSKFADFTYFNAFNMNNLLKDEEGSVIGDTIRLRESIGFPRDSLLLSEDDASVLIMKCLGDHEAIYWMNIEDLENFIAEKPLIYSPLVFKTFQQFLEYLLDNEE